MATIRGRKVLYAVRTTAGQEINVAVMVELRAKAQHYPLYSIIVPDTLRGTIFIEAEAPYHVDRAIYRIKHVRGRIPGLVSIDEIKRHIMGGPAQISISPGDTVVIISSPLKGMKAKVVRVDALKNEVTVELLDLPYSHTITLRADYVKLYKKAGEVSK